MKTKNKTIRNGLTFLLSTSLFFGVPILVSKLDSPQHDFVNDDLFPRTQTSFYEDGRVRHIETVGVLTNVYSDTNGDGKIDGGTTYVMVPTTMGALPLLSNNQDKNRVEEIIRNYKANI